MRVNSISSSVGFHGTSNQNQPQITWKNPWDDSGYDPNDPNK